MDHTFQATTVEMDQENYGDLQQQLLDSRVTKPQGDGDIRDKPEPRESKARAPSPSRKFAFTKGEDKVELDDDYEFEFMADKQPTKLTLRELKDRAAGDIAVKNRMHSLAEEKKRIQGTFKQFADMAMTDPLGALEFISNKARETNSEFEYQKYIEKLAEQAEKLGQMDEKERKAWELEKKLQKAEQDLSQKERQQAVVLRKQEMLTDYPEIGDSQFRQMVDAVLNSEDLMDNVESEHEIMDKVEELIQETLTQRDIISVIREINPDHVQDNRLIFTLSDQIRQNPDLDEEDVRDILRELIGQRPPERQVQPSQRDRDIRTLSNKARQGTPAHSLRTQSATPYQLLEQQLLERKETMKKTPLYMR